MKNRLFCFFRLRPKALGVQSSSRFAMGQDMRVIQLLYSFGCLMAAIFLAINASGATYYIDWVSGLDSNNGTSINTPWKRHPFMRGWTGSYTHVAGDRYIFKGGVTWPGSCWRMDITVGGSATKYDYYGVTNNWFTGASWSRPIFDGTGSTFEAIMIRQVKYVFIESFEIINMTGEASVYCVAPNFTTLSNLYIHKWYRGTTDGEGGGIYNNYAGGSPPCTMEGFLITHCDIGNPDGGRDSGVCIRGAGEVAFCKLHNAPEQILHGGWSVHDNEFYNNVPSFLGDAAQHPNVCYWDLPNGDDVAFTGDVLFYNNYIHDIRGPGLPVIYAEPAFSTPLPPVRNVYVYNNVVVNSASSPMLPDNEGFGGGSTVNIHVFNNTFECTTPASAIINDTSHGGPDFSWLNIRNNHFIGGGGNYANQIFTSVTLSNHLKQTLAQANAAGFFRNSFYAPTSATSATVGVGANLSSYSFLPGFDKDTSMGGTRTPTQRPSGGNWDIGAFVHGPGGIGGNLAPSVYAGSDATVTLPTNSVILNGSASDPEGAVLTRTWTLTSGSGTVNISAPFSLTTSATFPTIGAYTLRLTVSDGTNTVWDEANVTVNPVPPPVTASMEAESGQITDPFTVSGGAISQSVQTLLTGSGRATYSFTVLTNGNYQISVLANAPSDAANSLYVTIDAEPTEPYNVWDIPVTSGYETRIVSWRGAGTPAVNEFTPKTFFLTAGVHTLIILGREPNVSLDKISIVGGSASSTAPLPPPNLRVISSL